MNTYPVAGFADPFSALSHLLAAGVCLGFAVLLIRQARGHWGHRVSVVIYSLACIGLLGLSGTYHLLPEATTGRYVLRVLDHAAIFFLIAASFTPIHAIAFRGWWRWGVLTAIWILAIAGITLKSVFFSGLPQWAGLALYLALGWLGLLSGITLWRRLGGRLVGDLLKGGIAYSLGGLVDYLEAPVLIPGVIGPHEVFHVFVLFGIGWHWRFIHRIAEPGVLAEAKQPTESVGEAL